MIFKENLKKQCYYRSGIKQRALI